MNTVKFGFKAEEIIKAGRTTRADILAIKEWQFLSRYPKLTDEQICLFLTSTRNDHNLAQRAIDSYFHSKLDAPQIFRDRNVDNEDLQRIVQVVSTSVMPRRYNGSAIMIIRLIDTNYRNYDLRCYTKLLTMTMESIYVDDPPESLITIFDCSGYTFMHLTKLRLKIAKTISEFTQRGHPTEIGRFYAINMNYIAEAALNLFRPFLKSDVLEKIELCRSSTDFKWFHKFIPKEYLPKEYEGELDFLHVYHEENLRRLSELQPYFEQIERQVYNDAPTVNIPV